MKVRVTIEFTYELPDEEDERLDAYNRVGLEDCVALDLEVDPAATLADADDISLVKVEKLK